MLRRAREIAEKYQIIIHFSDGDYFGRVLELVNVINDGKTPAACIENAIDIATTAVACMLEKGQVPPVPASMADERRDQQVNVRLSNFERLLLEDTARTRGYRGISDFMRAATLASVR